MRNLKHKKDGTTVAFGRLPLALAVIAVCTQGYAADATKDKAGIPFSPFAYLSLNLQNFSESSGGNGFPAKIMLMIDDSGSMADLPFVPGATRKDSCDNYEYTGQYQSHFITGRRYFRLTDNVPPNQQIAAGGYCWFCLDGTKPTVSKSDPKKATCSHSQFGDGNAQFLDANGYVFYLSNLFQAGKENTDVNSENNPSQTDPRSKFEIAMEAMTGILKNPEYKNKFYWSVISLNTGTTKTPIPYTLDNNAVLSRLSYIKAEGATPSTSRYMDAFTHVVRNMEHVCQKNYIVVLSDGDSSLEEPNLNKFNRFRSSAKPNEVLEGFTYVRSGNITRAYSSKARPVDPFFGPLPKNYTVDGYYPIDPKYDYIPKDSRDLLDFLYPIGGRTYEIRSARCPAGTTAIRGGHHDVYIAKTPEGYNSSAICAYSDENVYEKDHGIAFFAKRLATKDVKSSKNAGIFKGDKDKEGLDWDDTTFPPQTIKTYTIGFGSGLSGIGRAYLKNAASMLDSDGDGTEDSLGYFSALSQKELDHAFKMIVNDIKNNGAIALKPTEGHSVSSPAVTPSKDGGFGIALTLNTANWSSTLEFTQLDKKGNIVKEKDKDGVEKPKRVSADYSSRKIIVNDGTKNTLIDAADAPKADFYGFSKEQENDFAQYFKPWYTRSSNISDPAIRDGAAKLAAAAKKVAQYRVRAEKADDPQRMMADVLGTPILSTQKYVMTAANDGMVYIFKAQEGEKPFTLALNYLPAAMERESVDGSDTVAKALAATAEEGYGKTVKGTPVDAQPHLFLNNGGMQWRATSEDAEKGDKSGVYIAGAMGQGGRGAYVLSVSGFDRVTKAPIGLDAGEGNWSKTVPLWETAKGADNLLAYTVNTPQFGQVATKYDNGKAKFGDEDPVRQYLFLANGYHGREGAPVANSPVKLDNGPTLYIYEALGLNLNKGNPARTGKAAGDLIAKLTVKDGVGGLSTPVLVDTDRDFLFDHAYAGDQGGNLYRFTFNKENVAEWTVHKIYQGNKSQPITAQPAIYRGRDGQDNKLVIVVGTGSDVYQEDLKSKDPQVMMGIFDDVNDEDPKVLTSDDLAQQKVETTVQADGKTVAYLTDNPVKDKKGWQLLLNEENGERVVTQASILNSTAFFSSRIYDSSETSSGSKPDQSSAYSCKTSETKAEAKGESWIYGVDVLTGSNPKKDSARFKNLPPRTKPIDNNGNTGGGNSGGSEQQEAAGYKEDGLTSGVVLSSLDEPKSVSQHGAAQSGQDETPGVDKTKSYCISRKEADKILSHSSTGKGYDEIGVDFKICPESARLIRINTREIKESVLK